MHHDTDDMNALLEELRQAGQEPAQTLLDGVKALGPAVVRPLIEMATDEALHNADQERPQVWAPLHAIQILGDLGAAEAVEPLLPLLGWNEDWLNEVLPEAFGGIGQPAIAPLRAMLGERTQETWAREGAAAALAQIAQQHPELWDEVVATLVARLAGTEPHTPADETLNGLIIARLLDLKAAEAAPAIERAFAEDRVDQRIVDLDWARYELGLAPEPEAPFPQRETGLRLWLHCTACGSERPHEVEKVYCDVGTMERRRRGEEAAYSEFVIPQPITCPKCGAVDQYELTDQAQLALVAEGLVQTARADAPRRGARTSDEDAEPPLVYTRFTVAGGREMHPRAAQEMYRQQVAADPENMDIRVRYASVLRFLGQREEAVRQYQAVLQHDPSNADATLNLGIFARAAGDRMEAHRLFARVLEIVPHVRMSRREREEYMSYARAELESLEDPGRGAVGQGVPAPVLTAAAAGRTGTVLAPEPSTRATPKVGRNDPCPCGSGKKYKKCCGH